MTPTVAGIREWLARRADAYFYVVTALVLNMPFLSVALARHLEGVAYTSLAGVYVELVFLGYYALILLVLLSGLFAVLVFSTRLAVAAARVLMVSALFYLVVNSIIHHVYRFHIDAFWLEYLFTSYGGIGISPSLMAITVGALVAIIALEWGLFRLAGRLSHRGRLAGVFAAAIVVSFSVSQAIHIVGYDKNDARITSITPQLPFYYPIVSHRDALKYGDLVPLVTGSDRSGQSGEYASLHYPLHDVPCQVSAGKRLPNILMIVLESWRSDMMDALVSPNIHALSLKSSLFLKHFSSGNATPTGIFGLFYGIHPTYWTAVKANSAVIHNPVLIDALQANGYAFGIYADSHFGRHKIKDTIFRDIDVHESFAGDSPDCKDRDMNRQLIGFMDEQQRRQKPFMAFAFYKSTHYSYYYPESAARFRPSQKLNVAFAGNARNPALYLNDYRNSIRYVDELVGEVIHGMEESGLLKETIIIVTSDHGEEFNDNHANYWGHTGNFTRYQTQVPMILYVPWARARRVTEMTTHVDVPPTLIQEGLGCEGEVRDYSNGRNLFAKQKGERPLVLSSYVNHALIMGDDVFAVYPMYVQKYKLSDIKSPAGVPRGDLVKKAMEEMHRFYGGPERRSAMTRAAQ